MVYNYFLIYWSAEYDIIKMKEIFLPGLSPNSVNKMYY